MADNVEDELRRALASGASAVDPVLDLQALHATARRRSRRRAAVAGAAAVLVAAAVPALYMAGPDRPDTLLAQTAEAPVEPAALAQAALDAVGPGATLAHEPEALPPGELDDRQAAPSLLPRRRVAGATVEIRVPREGADWLYYVTSQRLRPELGDDQTRTQGAWLAEAAESDGLRVDGLPDAWLFPVDKGWAAVRRAPDGSLLAVELTSTEPESAAMRGALVATLRALTVD